MEEQSLEGHLLPYYEQGWEGRIEFAFQPDGSEEWRMLRAGDQLTIFAEDGGVLWSGEIEWVKPGFWERRRNKLTIWSWSKQKGVAYAQWLQWFWHQPPLRAVYVSG